MKTILLKFKNEAQFYRLRADKQRREKKERRLITWEEYVFRICTVQTIKPFKVKLTERRENGNNKKNS